MCGKLRKFVQYPLLLPLLFLLIACQEQSEDTTIVVTEVVVFEGSELVITRLVEQTATPEPVQIEPQPQEPTPIELDLGLSLPFVNEDLQAREPRFFPNLDPQTAASDHSYMLIENLFVGLTNYNHENNQIEPELASSWEVSRDGRIWTFNLRDDIFWVQASAEAGNAVGLLQPVQIRPVTAEDVVFAVQRICQQETGTPDAFVLFIIEGCEESYRLSAEIDSQVTNNIGVRALDSVTLQFTLNKAASHFLSLTSMPFFKPVPKERVEELGSDWQTAVNLYTSGPFLPSHLPQSTADTRAQLQRNLAWPIPFRGNVDQVNLLILNEDEELFDLWEAKSLDLAPLPPSKEEAVFENQPQRVRTIPDQTAFFVGFNFDSPVFQEREVRQAFSAAIDRERLVEELYDGQAFPSRHLLPPNIVGGLPVGEVGVGYSPDYAAIQMAASSYRSCRLMPPVHFLVSTSDFSLQQAELIRDMWIDVLKCTEDQIIIEQARFGALLANTRQEAGNARPDLWEFGWASYYPDAHNWFGDLVHCEESENRQNRPCSEADSLIRTADTLFSLSERSALYRQVENLFFNDSGLYPLIPLYLPVDYEVIQTWLTVTPAPLGGKQLDTFVVDNALKRLEQTR